MTIGFCLLELYLPESGSLKGKRSILEGLTKRVRNKFNISISELSDNDLWQKAVLGVAIVCNDSRHANQVLSKVVDLVQKDHRVHLVDYSLEMI
ncbi:MAG: hypothetical protein CME25_05675 [Gemmatimonadetes bacterium]|nr:hypothetical protein [Gemmatimonadota bacterium]|tara:strand:- start:77 stop:358 length:282 start_codon:yes stop_codon:yes gene_type:complete